MFTAVPLQYVNITVLAQHSSATETVYMYSRLGFAQEGYSYEMISLQHVT